jgi:hypothetical protein
MKNILQLLLLLGSTLSNIESSRAQTPAWQHSSDWTLYNLGGKKFYKVKLDSLSFYNHRPLDDDSMHNFLAHSSALVSDQAPLWMGAFVASCMIDNKMHKIDISSYGTFFFDETDKKYFSVTQGVQKDWLKYFANSAGSIPLKQ